MKKKVFFRITLSVVFPFVCTITSAQTKPARQVPKYDTIIRKHVTKPVAKPIVKQEIVLPVPEFINQPYYYDESGNKLIKLENTTARMINKKKTLGLKGARQSLSIDGSASRIRFTTKKDIVFFIKTSGDVIDLTSYIKLYRFASVDQKREVTINAQEGLLNNKDEAKGKLLSFSVKLLSKDNYMIQLSEQLEAGEYGFVWVKNMELKELTMLGFGIDWKNSD